MSTRYGDSNSTPAERIYELMSEDNILRNVTSIKGLDSGKIDNLLSQKHYNDVYVSQCKNGSTWFPHQHLLKMDAWVLKRTYSPLTAIGYEIKVDRQDFENDQKWVDYVPMCHEFYFVCPAGLIRSDDLPNNIGLIWVSTTDKLHTKHKAERMKPDVDKLNSLMTYVLMSRSVIVADMNEANKGLQEPKTKLELYRDCIKDSENRQELAYFIKGYVRKFYTDYLEKDRELKYREQRVEQFARDLKRLGITWDSTNSDWHDTNRVANEIRLLKNQIDSDTLWQMNSIGKGLIELVSHIEELRKETEVKE